jgi:hypothetical protein
MAAIDVRAAQRRLLAAVFARRPVGNGLSFEPTPGAGDSDGGDLYGP